MKIYIENLPKTITKEDIIKLFSRYGQVESVYLIKDPKTGKSTGAAYVEMDSEIEADQAVAGLDGVAFKGQELHVIFEEDEPEFPPEDNW